MISVVIMLFVIICQLALITWVLCGEFENDEQDEQDEETSDGAA